MNDATINGEDLYLVVDGSYRGIQNNHLGPCGAGLVLATGGLTTKAANIVAYCAIEFVTRSNHEAEVEAIRRGLEWTSLTYAWSDSTSAIDTVNLAAWETTRDANIGIIRARFLPHNLRKPLHNFAHHLSDAASKRDHERFWRIRVPG